MKLKTPLLTSLASLVLLLPSHGQVHEGGGLVSSIAPAKTIVMPALEPQKPLETALHPLLDYGTYSNLYVWGNCTAYVASRLPVPNSWGNANTWDDAARAEGLTVTAVPKVGAIAQSDSDSYFGHVAIVTAVNADVVTVSEMNFNGLGIIDQRIAKPNEFIYIYL